MYVLHVDIPGQEYFLSNLRLSHLKIPLKCISERGMIITFKSDYKMILSNLAFPIYLFQI